MRKTRNLVPSGASVRIRPTSNVEFLFLLVLLFFFVPLLTTLPTSLTHSLLIWPKLQGLFQVPYIAFLATTVLRPQSTRDMYPSQRLLSGAGHHKYHVRFPVLYLLQSPGSGFVMVILDVFISSGVRDGKRFQQPIEEDILIQQHRVNEPRGGPAADRTIAGSVVYCICRATAGSKSRAAVSTSRLICH